MKKRIWLFVLLAVLPFGGILAANSLRPVATARWFLRGSEWWQQEWPLARGKYIPIRLNNLLFELGILRPVRAGVRGFTMELDLRDLVTQSILGSGIWEPESTRVVEALPEWRFH